MKLSKIFELFIAAALFVLAIYAGLSDGFSIPGRVSMNSSDIEPPGTFFISSAIFCMSLSLFLFVLKHDKCKKLASILFVCSFILFIVGLLSGVS